MKSIIIKGHEEGGFISLSALQTQKPDFKNKVDVKSDHKSSVLSFFKAGVAFQSRLIQPVMRFELVP